MKVPTLDEVKLIAAKMGLPDYEAECFYFYYERRNWYVRKKKMGSWTAALVNWRNRWLNRR